MADDLALAKVNSSALYLGSQHLVYASGHAVSKKATQYLSNSSISAYFYRFGILLVASISTHLAKAKIMFDRKYNIENPAIEILSFLEENQYGFKHLRRRSIIYRGDNEKWVLQGCVIEGFSKQRDVKPETSRQYPSGVILFEDWLSFKELEEVIAQTLQGKIIFEKEHIEATSSHRRWEQERQPLMNPYMQYAGHVWSARFQDHHNSMQGELLSPSLPYYPNLHEAVKDWLPYPIYHQSYDHKKGEIIILLPETRAYFEHAIVQESKICLCIGGTGTTVLPLLVTGAWWDKDIHHFSTPVTDGHACFEVPDDAKQLDFVLMGTDGTVYDFQQETEYRHCGLRITHRKENPGALANVVSAACQNGEGVRTEFKPYIRPNNDKLKEVIRTVVAFANTDGGRIFFGISDGCEVDGINIGFQEENQSGLDEAACAKYLGNLGGKIREELRGDVHLEFGQVSVDGRWVAIIEVAEADVKPVTTRQEERVLYVRRGSTNAKARPAEWKEIMTDDDSNPFLSSSIFQTKAGKKRV